MAERALRETIEMAGLADRFDEIRVVDSDDIVLCLGEAVDAFGGFKISGDTGLRRSGLLVSLDAQDSRPWTMDSSQGCRGENGPR